MKCKNQYHFNTMYGDKSFELYHENILHLTKDCKIMVFSAYQNSYQPKPNTLIASFEEETGLIMKEIANNPMLDFRSNLGVWVSKPLENCKYKYVMCIEFIGRKLYQQYYKEEINIENAIAERIKNFFKVLEFFDQLLDENCSLVMPLIGTGRQKISPEYIMKHLLSYGERSLERCKHIENIYISEMNEEKVNQISIAMDHILGRDVLDTSNLFISDDCASILKDIKIHLGELMNQEEKYKNDEQFVELLLHLKQENSTFIMMAVLARKILEKLLYDILEKYDLADLKTISLNKKINLLASKHLFPMWIITYMHNIRTLGNEQVHSSSHYDETITPIYRSLTLNTTIYEQKVLLIALCEILKAVKDFLMINDE